jgi:hypothetical protein
MHTTQSTHTYTILCCLPTLELLEPGCALLWASLALAVMAQPLLFTVQEQATQQQYGAGVKR